MPQVSRYVIMIICGYALNLHTAWGQSAPSPPQTNVTQISSTSTPPPLPSFAVWDDDGAKDSMVVNITTRIYYPPLGTYESFRFRLHFENTSGVPLEIDNNPLNLVEKIFDIPSNSKDVVYGSTSSERFAEFQLNFSWIKPPPAQIHAFYAIHYQDSGSSWIHFMGDAPHAYFDFTTDSVLVSEPVVKVKTNRVGGRFPTESRIYPNPANDHVYLPSSESAYGVEIRS
ncbi:MAG: hypothetical protein AAF206_18555, partial [Bacteroidota bacterium]